MNCRRPVGLAAVALLVSAYAAVAQPATAPSSVDAARQYEVLLDTVRDRTENAAAGWRFDWDSPLDEKAEQFLLRNKDVLDQLRAAGDAATSARPGGMVTTTAPAGRALATDDLETELKRLSPAHAIANVAALRARWSLAHGRPAEAAEDLLTVRALARHVGQRPLLVSQFAAIGIETLAIERLAASLPRLPDDVRRSLPARATKLPPPLPLADVLAGELAYARAHPDMNDVPNPPLAMLDALGGDPRRFSA